MSETNMFYLLYRNGQISVVSQKDWESDWLRWWKQRNNKRLRKEKRVVS